MKLLYIADGSSIHSRRWLKWFAEHGHEIHLITYKSSELDNIVEHDLNANHYSINRIKRYLKLQFNITFARKVRAFAAVKKIINQINPDILHLHTLYYPSFLGVLIGFSPLVITPWDGDITWSRDRTKLHKLFLKYSFLRANLITVDSNELKKECFRYSNREKKIHIIQWGVDLSKFNLNSYDERIRSDLGINKDVPLILSTRSFGSEYNIDIIIRSIPLVLREFPDAVFVFTWYYGSIEKELKQLLASLDVDNQVRFLGRIDHEDLYRIYSSSDVYVSISSVDTTPVSLLEGMSSGCGIVATDLESIREWIKDGWNGFLVKERDVSATADAILNHIKDQKKRAIFAERNSEIIKNKANHDAEMRKMEQLYYSLIRENNV